MVPLRYATLAILFLFIWIILFLKRKDLRKEMLFSSTTIWLFAFYDYLSQPTYWKPITLFSLPIGIEGFLFAFAFSGIAAVLYEEMRGKHLRKVREDVGEKKLHWGLMFLLVILSIVGAILFKAPIMITLLFLLAIGSVIVALLRPDLRQSIFVSGVFFGLIYALLLFIWLRFFPDALSWWNLDVFGGLHVFGVPIGEVTFGFTFGAFWGPIYEFLFGYKLVSKRASN